MPVIFLACSSVFTMPAWPHPVTTKSPSGRISARALSSLTKSGVPSLKTNVDVLDSKSLFLGISPRKYISSEILYGFHEVIRLNEDVS